MERAVIVADFKGKGYEFARGVYEKARELAEGMYSLNFFNVEEKIFGDGERREKISDNIREHNCFFIHDSNKNPDEWFTSLMLTLEAMDSSSAGKINLVMPYMRFARQDRKDESRVSVGSKGVATMASEYIHRGVTVDLHAPQTSQYFGPRVSFDNLYSFPVLADYLVDNHGGLLENLVVVSPDLGGTKRAGSLRKRLRKKGIEVELAICYKERDEKGKVREVIVIGDVEGKNCLMVDDIISSGGTFIEGCSALRENGAESVSGYGAHGLFTEGTERLSCLDRVIVSDSLYVEPFNNLEVLSLVDLFGKAVHRTIMGESLSSLFDGEE